MINRKESREKKTCFGTFLGNFTTLGFIQLLKRNHVRSFKGKSLFGGTAYDSCGWSLVAQQRGTTDNYAEHSALNYTPYFDMINHCHLVLYKYEHL